MPGPLGTDTNSPVIDEGTLALTRTRTPGPIGTDASSSQERVAEASPDSLPMPPAEPTVASGSSSSTGRS